MARLYHLSHAKGGHRVEPGSASAWAELQVAVNEYRLLSGEERDEAARRELVGRVNEVIKADTGRWASRRRSLTESRAS
jgi:hypothetical protein